MKRSRFTLIFLLPLVSVICLLLIILAGIPLSIPQYASESFGPPADNLSLLERIYFSTYIILNKKTLTTPHNPLGGDISFRIELGESPGSVTSRLYELSLVHNKTAFRNYLIYSGLDTKIQAGEYTLNPLMTPIEIAKLLQDPKPTDINFVILAGWRVEEIAASLAIYGLGITPNEFIAYVDQNDFEGYLLPGRYTINREITVDLLVRLLVNAFNQNLSPELEAGFSQAGLSVREAVILASIVEREAVVENEMPLIASVFINRLNINMKLDADPTVQYAVGFNASQDTWWTNPLSSDNLTYDSPYNTYLYFGLPPGPICNPSLNALRAVSFPAQTPYYYFRASCDNSGLHVFSETFEEHVAKTCP